MTTTNFTNLIANALAAGDFDAVRAAVEGSRPSTVEITHIVRNGRGFKVSTSHIPLGLYDGTKYETMVFDDESSEADYCDRYKTEEEARAGHARAVREFWPGKKTSPAPVEF